MFARNSLSRRFAWKKVLDIPGFDKAIKRRRNINLAKFLTSGLTTCFFFAEEWYTLSTFAAMITGVFLSGRFSDPLYKNLILTVEVDDEDKSAARIKTMQGYYKLNVDAITSLTDVYPAYRALQSAQELFHSQQSNIATFDDGRQAKMVYMRKSLENTRDDTVGHLGSIASGRTVPYHEFADRFHFFFRQGEEVFAVGFPFSPEVVFDSEELMRVLAGNKPLKPRRSVMLAQEDENIALEAEEKLRLRLKGEQPQELPTQKKEELPGSTPQSDSR